MRDLRQADHLSLDRVLTDSSILLSALTGAAGIICLEWNDLKWASSVESSSLPRSFSWEVLQSSKGCCTSYNFARSNQKVPLRSNSTRCCVGGRLWEKITIQLSCSYKLMHVKAYQKPKHHTTVCKVHRILQLWKVLYVSSPQAWGEQLNTARNVTNVAPRWMTLDCIAAKVCFVFWLSHLRKCTATLACHWLIVQ